jgi:hypothetical protein
MAEHTHSNDTIIALYFILFQFVDKSRQKEIGFSGTAPKNNFLLPFGQMAERLQV